jgi:hypothetical protein
MCASLAAAGASTAATATEEYNLANYIKSDDCYNSLLMQHYAITVLM